MNKTYVELFRRAARGPVQITCDSHLQARSLRSDLYRERARFLRDGGACEIAAACILAEGVRLRIEGKVLIAEPKEKPFEILVDKALASEGG